MRPTGRHSAALKTRSDVTTGLLAESYRRLWSSPAVGAVVPEFLILMHQIVRASVPLMELAHDLAAARSVDPVSRPLARYLSSHVDEERHHDAWLLDDLVAAGVPSTAVLARAPSPQVAALVGAQYYWMRHHDPVALLGYIRVLEGQPPRMTHIDRLQRASGLPAAAFRTYRLHGELDPGHVGELDRFLDSLPLSSDQGYLVWASASHTAAALAACLDAIESDAASSVGHFRSARAVSPRGSRVRVGLR